MKYLVIIIMLCSALIQGQENPNLLSGKLILTKDGITIGNSQKLTKGTELDFEYDGKELSV